MAIIEWSAGFEATPAGSDPGSVLDERINELKEQIRRRLEQGGHHMQEPTPNEVRDGRHMVDGGAGTYSPNIYKSNETTVLVQYEDTYVDFKEPIYGYQTTSHINIAPSATGRIPGVIIYNRGAGKLKMVEANLSAFNAPSGGNLVIDIHRLTSAWTDPNATANPPDEGSIWNTIPSITASAFKGGPFTDFHTVLTAPQYLAVGEAWVVECDTLSGAANITLILKTVREAP